MAQTSTLTLTLSHDACDTCSWCSADDVPAVYGAGTLDARCERHDVRWFTSGHEDDVAPMVADAEDRAEDRGTLAADDRMTCSAHRCLTHRCEQLYPRSFVGAGIHAFA